MLLTEQQAKARTHLQRAYALVVKAIHNSVGVIDETSHAMCYMEAAMYQCRDALSHFNRAAQAFNEARKAEQSEAADAAENEAAHADDDTAPVDDIETDDGRPINATKDFGEGSDQ